MSEAFDAFHLFVGVLINAIYGVLVFVGKRLTEVLERSRPAARRVVIPLTLLVTIGANLALYYLAPQRYPIFGTVLLLILFWLFWRELRQFWIVGLIGADRTIRAGIDYGRSLKMCNNSLSFLGVGARKLTEVSSEFELAMQRCNRPNRPIRFLLCRPDRDILEKAAFGAGRPADEYRHRVTESLRAIADLRHRRRWNIEVRFYDVPVPLFRLMFIDDWLCLASHYVFGEGDGSDWPQLHVRRSAIERDVNSLYHPFSVYFEQLWEVAQPWDFSQYLSNTL